MKRLILPSIAFLLLVAGSAVTQEGPPPVLMLQGNAEAAEQTANSVCTACHGPDGNSTIASYPRLAGQLQPYLAVQLWAFREGLRPGTIMNEIAADLTDQQIADLAAYFASEEPAGAPWPDQDQAAVERGAVVFNTGNVHTDVIACAICHGPQGQGVAPVGVPRIAGQGPAYLREVLSEFAMVEDFGSPIPNAMHVVASNLTDEDFDAVVAFLASQPWGSGE